MKRQRGISIRFTVNGAVVSLEVDPTRTLLEVLREDLGLTGTKKGCGRGNCGSCTVLVDGEAVNSCLILAPQIDRKKVVTIEGLAEKGELDSIQKAFVNVGAVQCGFCTPGMILSAKALLLKTRYPTRAEIRKAISGNLCRCTGYAKIVDAIEKAARSTPGHKT